MSSDSDNSERSNSPIDDKSKDPTVKFNVIEPSSSRISRSGAGSVIVKSSSTAVGLAKSQNKPSPVVLPNPTAVGPGMQNPTTVGSTPSSPSGPAPSISGSTRSKHYG